MVFVNLIPADVQIAQKRRRHIRRWVTGSVLAAALFGGVLGLDWLNRAEAERLRNESRLLSAKLETDRKELKSVTAKVGELRVQIERAKALQAKRAWSGMIGLITTRLPDGCWLTSIATDPAQPKGGHARPGPRRPAAGASPPPNMVIDAPRKLEITGYAPSAAQPHDFVAALKAAEVFTDVTLSRSQREPMLDGSYYRFELICQW